MGRSRSQFFIEAPSSGHVHPLKKSERSSSRSPRRRSLNNNIDDLPDHLLAEILCRLPCNKMVFQCRCVSKSWCTLISNPNFICRFLRLQINKQAPMKGNLININGYEIHTGMLPVLKRLMTVHGLKEDPLVVGAYNDFVLCCASKYHQRDYYICNPYTSQWVALPPAPSQCEWTVPAGLICDTPYYNYKQDDARKGSFIVQVNPEYRCKVVRLLPRDHFPYDAEEYDSYNLKVEIFSFETGEWRESVVSSPIPFSSIDAKSNFVYNGMLYWSDGMIASFIGLDPFMINNIKSSGTTCSNGYDVIDYYKCRLITFNDPAKAEDNTVISLVKCLGVYGGCLRMCDLSFLTNTVFVYDLKEEEEEKEEDGHDRIVIDEAGKFCLKHRAAYSLDRNMFPPGRYHAEPIAFDLTNADILYLCVDDDVVMYNIRTGEWSKIDVKKNKVEIDGYVYSFVLPCWPTPVPRLPQHARP